MGRNGDKTMINPGIRMSFVFVSCSLGGLGIAFRLVDGVWKKIQPEVRSAKFAKNGFLICCCVPNMVRNG